MFTSWDLALVVAVSAMGTAVAYVRNPEHKAFVLMLPVPFTLATLALGRPLDATHVLAMGLLFGFTVGVWALHTRLRWPILVSIPVCALAYCAVGAVLNRWLPSHGMAFWCAVPVVFTGALLLVRSLPYRVEPHHRTHLPVWIKLPAIALVVTGLIAIKQYLGGFMTMFPMVGVIAAHEARHSLWTMVRRIPWVILIMAPMMALIRLTQDRIGLPGALGLAWLLLFALLWLLRSHYHGGSSEVCATEDDPLSEKRNGEETESHPQRCPAGARCSRPRPQAVEEARIHRSWTGRFIRMHGWLPKTRRPKHDPPDL